MFAAIIVRSAISFSNRTVLSGIDFLPRVAWPVIVGMQSGEEEQRGNLLRLERRVVAGAVNRRIAQIKVQIVLAVRASRESGGTDCLRERRRP